jgi:hypothetical protein
VHKAGDTLGKPKNEAIHPKAKGERNSIMSTIDGTLETVANESFLIPKDGGAEVHLVMRNMPPGGDFDERSAAATAYLTETVGAHDSDPITVNGDSLNPHVFLVDSAQLR